MKVRPKTYHLTIKPDPVEEKSKGGIVFIKDKLAEVSTVIGTVLDVGPDCWPEHKFKEQAAYVGDRVIYQRGSGMRVPDGKGGYKMDLLILVDLDIVSTIIDDEPEEEKTEWQVK